MTAQEELEPWVIDEIEVQPSGRALYLVHHAGTGEDLGAIRVCDDRRWEAITPNGRFAGVHKTAAEAVDSLSMEVNTGPIRGTGTAVVRSDPSATERRRPIRRGVYGRRLARRNITP